MNWEGQIPAREALRTDFWRNILQPLQRHADRFMKQYQKVKFFEDEEVWTITIDWTEGKYLIHEPTQLMKNAARYGQHWKKRMKELARGQGIYDHTHGDFEMEIKQNDNYDGYYSTKRGPKNEVVQEEKQWREEADIQQEYERKMNDMAASPSMPHPTPTTQSQQRSRSRQRPSTGAGIERRMVVFRANGARPRTPSPATQTQRARARTERERNQSRSPSRSRSRSRNGRRQTTQNESDDMQTATVYCGNVRDFCQRMGIDLDDDPSTTTHRVHRAISPEMTDLPTSSDEGMDPFTQSPSPTHRNDERGGQEEKQQSPQEAGPDGQQQQILNAENGNEMDDESGSESESSWSQRSMPAMRE